MTNKQVNWVGCLMAVALVAGAGCTEKSNFCKSDSDCPNALPFCDVNGEFAESGGEKNVCTITPAACPVERCGCQPGATTCSAMTLTTCNADGKSTTSATCALGCSMDGLQCGAFEPSNGLGSALTLAGSEPDVVIPAGSRIDTATGNVTAPNSTSIAVKTLALADGGVTTRVLIAHSFDIGDVVVSGPNPIAFVATDKVFVRGHLDASATGVTPGPGAQLGTATCSGVSSASGGTGAGGATTGGRTGPAISPVNGGAMFQGFAPLRGGCGGGAALDSGGQVVANGNGGVGGGAVQFVSQTTVQIGAGGIVDVGGGGGRGAGGGGGAGGVVVIEAPSVTLDALSAIVANGGAGGGCGAAGEDGRSDGMPAQPQAACGTHNSTVGGQGGTGAVSPTDGGDSLGTGVAGGGGAAGSIRIATVTGTYTAPMSALLSGAVTSAMIVVH